MQNTLKHSTCICQKELSGSIAAVEVKQDSLSRRVQIFLYLGVFVCTYISVILTQSSQELLESRIADGKQIQKKFDICFK